jgi:hypothetical protein
MSIVQGILQGFLGDWGMKVGDWYMANSLWINGIILFYALLISICWKNYSTVSNFLRRSLIDQISPKMKTWTKAEINKNLKSIEIPWEAARKKMFIPIMAKSGSYLPKFASIDFLQGTFNQDFMVESLRDINKK